MTPTLTMRVRDFRERIPDRGPMILYRVTLVVAVAVCLVLAVSASAKEPRSASVGEFQLTHPCPATGLRSGAYSANWNSASGTT